MKIHAISNVNFRTVANVNQPEPKAKSNKNKWLLGGTGIGAALLLLPDITDFYTDNFSKTDKAKEDKQFEDLIKALDKAKTNEASEIDDTLKSLKDVLNKDRVESMSEKVLKEYSEKVNKIFNKKP